MCGIGEGAMLDPWIIEEIRRREEERQQQSERPCLEMPYEERPSYSPPEAPKEDRGVAIVDFGVTF
jgi:hypothetical protein